MNRYDKLRKRILKRIFVGLTLFILSLTVLGFADFLFGNFFPWLGDGNPLTWICLITFVVVTGYSPVDQAYGWFFRRVLFPRRSQVLHLLNRLSQELALTSDLTELSNLLVNTLGEVLQLKTVSLLVRAPRGEGYVIASAYGWKVTDYRKMRFSENSFLLQLMKAAGSEVLLREKTAPALSWQEANQLTQDFDLLHATCAIPLWAKSELVGSINLLTPASGHELDEGDLRFFRDFGEEMARSVQSALVIQQLKISNEELRDAQSELLQTAKRTAIEQLATGIAHEIHNPLTIISGKAQVLLLQKDQKRYDEKVEEVLKTIVKQTRRAADITKKLLMFSRHSAPSREKLGLEGVLEDTVSLIAYQTSLEGIEIQRLVARDLPDFYGNIQELREVFFNLILNALQAAGPEGRIQVGITFEKADQLFVIQIADNGPGIPAENLDKVFNPFFTTRPEGIGLGLFVTQQIVHRYGGSIRVESEPGEGTLFVMELPLETPAVHSPAAGAAVSDKGGKEVHDSALSSG